ncbi:hypothetical protein BH23ACT11_BH23ACT11_17090 [soil metagenome]
MAVYVCLIPGSGQHQKHIETYTTGGSADDGYTMLWGEVTSYRESGGGAEFGQVSK